MARGVPQFDHREHAEDGVAKIRDGPRRKISEVRRVTSVNRTAGSDLVVERLEGSDLDRLGGGLGLKHHVFAGEGVSSLAGLGGGLLLHGHLHAHELDGSALLEISDHHRLEGGNDRGHFLAAHLGRFGDGVEDLALGTWCDRTLDGG